MLKNPTSVVICGCWSCWLPAAAPSCISSLGGGTAFFAFGLSLESHEIEAEEEVFRWWLWELICKQRRKLAKKHWDVFATDMHQDNQHRFKYHTNVRQQAKWISGWWLRHMMIWSTGIIVPTFGKDLASAVIKRGHHGWWHQLVVESIVQKPHEHQLNGLDLIHNSSKSRSPYFLLMRSNSLILIR